MTVQTTETQASDPAPTTTGRLTGFKFDLGHQETERIVDEMEQICKTVRNSAGDAWMLASSAQSMLCTDLGYEDAGELEVRTTARSFQAKRTCLLNGTCLTTRPTFLYMVSSWSGCFEGSIRGIPQGAPSHRDKNPGAFDLPVSSVISTM